MYDMTSLLLGAAIAGFSLSLTMFSFWSIQRNAAYKASWAIGVALMVLHVLAYWFFAQSGSMAVGALASAFLPLGTIVLYVAARQFVDGRYKPMPVIVGASVPYLLVVPPTFALGYDGLALVGQNAMTATMLWLSGAVYLGARREARLAVASMALLYIVVGVSFALCGIVLVAEGNWSIGYPPQNWAEQVNTIVSILGMTGAGALALALDQSRLANLNRASAMSDPLTGLLNRRGLAAVRNARLRCDEAVVLFDLDRFKLVNDRYGHAIGDEVIRRFAEALRAHGRPGDHKARLGGEEFVMIMEAVSPRQARSIAETIAAAFCAAELRSRDGQAFNCTVSAGIAFGDAADSGMDDAMVRADRALYAAKRAGRNRVEIGEWRLAG